jgi:hypothetical protein
MPSERSSVSGGYESAPMILEAVSTRFEAPTRGGSMATDCIAHVTFQSEGFAKSVVARFDRPDASSDGGLVLFKALDIELGLTERLAACLDDAREPGKVLHETIELLQQRIFGLCAGYADCNGAARLVHDPIHKLMVGRDPLTGLGLASQPTLSRFENAVTARELRAMTHVLADTVIAQQRRRRHGRAARITIDLDPTDDPTHGQQEFAFFNGHYDTWCYLPVVATVTFNDEPAQFAVAAVLRPGTAPAGLGARGASCGPCCASCAPPSRPPRSGCAWMGASPAPSCFCSWNARRSSTS